MSGRITDKWRPSLALVLGLTVAGMLALPAIGIVSSRAVGREIGYLPAQLLFGGLIIITAVVLGYVLWRILYGPIRALSARADQIKRGADGALEPMQHYGTQEMQQLGQAMLDMGRVLQGREAVLRSYADHATHELRSPLTAVRGAAELLAEGGLSDDDQARLINRIERASDRMEKLLAAQRALARAQEPLGHGRAPLANVVESLRKDHDSLSITITGDAILPLPPEQLAVVLDHLFGNAAIHGATEVAITAVAGGFDVADNGPGVSPGNRNRLFDPFFTTRRESGGTGMGLAIVRRMLQAHGGDITLADTHPGATFEVRF